MEIDATSGEAVRPRAHAGALPQSETSFYRGQPGSVVSSQILSTSWMRRLT
jgi:hypothetical protein